MAYNDLHMIQMLYKNHWIDNLEMLLRISELNDNYQWLLYYHQWYNFSIVTKENPTLAGASINNIFATLTHE